jgi:lipoyl(octanoyl) transferase
MVSAPIRLRVLPWEIRDGPSNMAWDEALLAAAAEPTLRFYGWDPPTVSLGYFQDHGAIAPRLPPGMPVVRRITGGGAIWHEDEVTYALTASRAVLPERMEDLYCILHRAVIAGLGRRGISLDEQARTVGDRRYATEPRCFASPAAHDVVARAGGKVLGSAGRQRGDRVLVHGSLKLGSNPWDGDAVAGCGVEAAAAREVLLEAVSAALRAEPVPGVATGAEAAQAAAIQALRYGDDAWVRLRAGPRA